MLLHLLPILLMLPMLGITLSFPPLVLKLPMLFLLNTMLSMISMLDTLRCSLDIILPLMPVLPMLDILERLSLRLSAPGITVRLLKAQVVLVDAVDLPSTTRKAETPVQMLVRGGDVLWN